MPQPSNRYKMDYAKENYSRIEITIPKSSRPILNAIAQASNESVAEYVKNAVLMRMGVKEWPQEQPHD